MVKKKKVRGHEFDHANNEFDYANNLEK